MISCLTIDRHADCEATFPQRIDQAGPVAMYRQIPSIAKRFVFQIRTIDPRTVWASIAG